MLETLQMIRLPQRLGGSLSLDFVNTVEFRHTGQPREFLHTYEHLLAWCWRAGLLDDEQAQRFCQLGTQDRAAAQRVCQRALALRETLYRIFAAVVDSQTPSAGDLALLNTALETMRRRIEPTGQGFILGWGGDDGHLERLLWPVIQAAADLLTSDHLARVRQCPNCGWLFVDTSRNHTRRWCSMEVCGSQVKSRRQYQRKRVVR